MRYVSFLLACTLGIVICISQAEANVFYNNTSLANVNLNPTQKFKSKPAYIKLAAIYFLPDNVKKNLSFNAQMVLYLITLYVFRIIVMKIYILYHVMN